MTPTRARRARSTIGVVALITALAALLVVTFLPIPYVIQQPGPAFNTLGEVEGKDGEKVPLISISGAETYETGGALDLTTVQVVGNWEHTPSWAEVAMAWLDPSRAVVPIESVFPKGVTSEQRDQQNQVLMVDSQQEATAAALRELDMDVPVTIEVAGVVEDSAATGVIEEGDRILALDGTAITDVNDLRARIQETKTAPVTLRISRGGAEQDVQVTPREQTGQDGKPVWLLGVTLTHDYTFPIDVKLQLDNVGGPSAGMMFALGIIDTLTPGELNGGEQVAGTGTIAADGTVGPIGGIRQKLYGARNAGADYFLAPGSNCDEVVGHVPDGLTVIRTDSLSESMDALEVIADGGDVAALPTCTATAR